MTEPSAPVRRILHCDMDCFYAAVHMRDDPTLAGKPVVVGGSPDGRGVVASASYEARRYGIRSAMPAARARRLCPHTVFLRADFTLYRRESEAIFAIFREYTPLVQPASLDEAYLDVTEHHRPWGSATGVAQEIRRRVEAERGLTVSVGVGPNRLVAKIASDMDKPDGLTVVRPKQVLAFLEPLAVRRLHGVGPATERALAELGVATIGDLRRIARETLDARFGSHGRWLHRASRGLDDRPVVTEWIRKSLGTERTFAVDLTDRTEILSRVTDLAEEVAKGLAKRDLAGRTVTLKVRYDDFTTVSRGRSLGLPVAAAGTIESVARDLLERTEAGPRPVRLLGVTVSNLAPARFLQLDLF